MFEKDFQRKYALTDQGIKNTKQGTIFTVIVNLVVMGGMGILYLLMTDRCAASECPYLYPAGACLRGPFPDHTYAAVSHDLWPGIQ